MKILILGNGIAGNHVAFTLRQLDFKGGITMLSAEKFPEYDPCSLPYYVSGEVSREYIFRKKTDDYKKNNISIFFDNKAVSVNPKTKNVITEKGDEFKYDKLILAYGGKQFIPDIKGINNKGVFSCKQLKDADNLNAHEGKTAVVIGSGAIGIEAAEALKRKGYEVYIVELMNWIMPTMFDEPAARILEKSLNSYGINVFTGEKLIEIEGTSFVKGIITNKRKISCDTVVIATGVIVDKSIAETAGINTNRAILTDKKLETNINNIYACGDCAETIDAFGDNNCNYQLKHNALEQANVIVQNISGKDISYIGAYPFARAHFFNTHASSFGKTIKVAGISDNIEIIERQYENNYMQVILKSGKIIGAQTIGKYADNMGLLLGAMWRNDDINEIRNNWNKIIQFDSPYPWTYRKLGSLLEMKH